MTNEERVQKFKSVKIAVNCSTEEEAKQFVKWCNDNGIAWINSTMSGTEYDLYLTDTCYMYHPVYRSLYITSKRNLEKCKNKIIAYKEFMKKDDNKITNLEWILNNVDKEVMNNHQICVIACDYIEKGKCMDRRCGDCKFYDTNYLLKFLQKEYKEKHRDSIKLSQFEYDLLRTNDQLHDRKLNSFATYKNMKELGYFKNVDFELTIKQVLDDCKVLR